MRLIDADETIRAITRKFDEDFLPIGDAIETIDNMPSAQPEQTKGKWEKGVSENGLTTALFCSACNYENKQWNEWNYCPNCGERMEREP